jgi:hypothetical protein
VGEEAALAHLQLRREAADRQPLQALDRGQVDGTIEDRGAGLGALASRFFRLFSRRAHSLNLPKSTNVRRSA